MPHPVSEKELIQMLRDPIRRRGAFEQVVERYGQRLYWQIRHLVTFHDDANDILQNTFLKAWAGIDSFRGEARLSTWLYRIAANESMTFIQQKRNTVGLDDAEADLANTLESDPYFDGDETQRQLQAAIQSLPPKQRQVFNLKYFDDMKYEEMAEVLDTSVGALKASYHIAVKKIEEFFHNLD